MDTVLYKNVTAIALTIKKLKKDIEKMNSSFNEETADLKNRNKITAENSKTYIEKLKSSTKDQIDKINTQIAELNTEIQKIDINKEIIKELKPYATNEALEQAIKDLQKSIDTISLTEGKQGEKGKDGLNGRDGKNGTNGKDGKDGKDGQDGQDGQDGLTPIITEVETETVGAGEFADVEIERNQQNEYKMKFKIPRGQKGASGANNAQGIEDIKVNGTSVVEDKIAEIIVPTKTSDLENDTGYIEQETDPQFNASASKNITSNDISNWNNKSDFSGSYNDLDNKPVIPNYTSGTGICIEDEVINSCTECGTKLKTDYIKDITIPNGNWKMCHTYDGALILFQVGSATIQVSRNYIDYEDYTFAHTVKDINYAYNNNVVLVLCNDGYIYYSFDNGITWVELYVSTLVLSGAGFEKIYIDNSNYTTTSTSPFTLFKLYGESGTIRLFSGALVNTNGTWGIYISNTYITPAPIRWVIKVGNDEMLITPTGVTYKTSGSNIVALNKDLPAGTITCVYTLNGVSIAGYGTTGKYAIYDNLSDTWNERSLPAACTINGILYDNGTYYFLTDNVNYYITDVFSTYTTINETTDRFKDGAFTLMGLVLIPNVEEEKLVLVPQRTFIDDVLLKCLRGIDKTRWVSDGLQVIGEKVQVKPGDSTIQVTNRGANVGIGSLSDIHLDAAAKLKLDMATSIIGKVAIANLESWFYTYAGFDPFTLFRIIFVDGGTTYNPLDYSDITVNAGDYGYFLINSTVDAMPFTLIGNLNEWSG